ncbi:type IV secretory system conjugative DNA transfer family protein, partial [Caenispirillum bisanense]|uniref:type IV secretory system conjugative DNA transfer family protein n=1 Tax=Caenispirillum bisanense TaxID=414052 RepID=UPI0031CFB7FA
MAEVLPGTEQHPYVFDRNIIVPTSDVLYDGCTKYACTEKSELWKRPVGKDSDEGGGFTALLNDMIAFHHGDPVIDAEVQRGANRMKLKAPQERSGVHSSAITGMALFADPLVAANTAASDFTVADLMHRNTPAALYLMVPPSDIGRVRPLLRI